jgi:hypothetical protein
VPGAKAGAVRASDVLLALRGNQVQLHSPGGDLLSRLPAPGGRALREQLQQLAWAKRLRLLAERHRRGVLPLEVHPPEFGGNFRVGSLIHFSVRPDSAAWLLLLNVDASGRVSVLYPYVPAELNPLAAGRARAVPGASGADLIRVQPPEGMDIQFAFAFDAEPPGLRNLLRLQSALPGDLRLAGLEPMLEAMSGRFTFAQSVLRVTAARPAAGRP